MKYRVPFSVSLALLAASPAWAISEIAVKESAAVASPVSPETEEALAEELNALGEPLPVVKKVPAPAPVVPAPQKPVAVKPVPKAPAVEAKESIPTLEIDEDEDGEPVMVEKAEPPKVETVEDAPVVMDEPTNPVMPEKPTKKATAAVQPKKPVVAEKPTPREIPLIETINPTRVGPEVNYVTGGIGEDEAREMEVVRGDYNLQVMSASNSGAFVGDANVIIMRGATEEMLNVISGPLLYVNLPAGTYTMMAHLGEQKKKQVFKVTNKAKPTRIHLGWKEAAKPSK
jgi:hypothetical protein